MCIRDRDYTATLVGEDTTSDIAVIKIDANGLTPATVEMCIRDSGWAKNIRDSKNIGFIALSDGGCCKTLQVVLEEMCIRDRCSSAPPPSDGCRTIKEKTSTTWVRLWPPLPPRPFCAI